MAPKSTDRGSSYRVDLAIEALSGHNTYGKVTHLAEWYGVSRTTVHEVRRHGQQALVDALDLCVLGDLAQHDDLGVGHPEFVPGLRVIDHLVREYGSTGARIDVRDLLGEGPQGKQAGRENGQQSGDHQDSTCAHGFPIEKGGPCGPRSRKMQYHCCPNVFAPKPCNA